MLKRSKPIRRGKRPKPVNRKRRATNLLRAYGPPERRAWVKHQPCVVGPLLNDPCEGPRENAHTEVLGKGIKAAYTTIIPTCRRHNATARRLAPDVRARLSAEIEARWQQENGE